MPDNDERREQILNAAAAVIVRLGYDKTSMSDIAAEAGVSRGTVYLYFKTKEDLFEALIYWEYMQYARTWLERIEADPRGGTVGGYYRAISSSINSYPLIASMLRRDRHVIGNYLQKKGNLFSWVLAGSSTTDMVRLLQRAGTVRQDVDPVVTGHIIDMLSYGQLHEGDFQPPDQNPSYQVVMEALAEMMDRWLTPEGGGSSEAGKAASRQIVAAVKAQIEQARQTKETKKTISKGANDDHR